jgi:hypothetical protein
MKLRVTNKIQLQQYIHTLSGLIGVLRHFQPYLGDLATEMFGFKCLGFPDSSQ